MQVGDIVSLKTNNALPMAINWIGQRAATTSQEAQVYYHDIHGVLHDLFVPVHLLIDYVEPLKETPIKEPEAPVAKVDGKAKVVG